MGDFNLIQQQATQLTSNFANRNTTFTELEKMFFMDDEDIQKTAKAMDNGKLTLSPDARNQLLGAVRLMIATDPQFSIPKDENEDVDDDTADEVEKFAQQMWNAAGRIYGVPIHYDAVLSALLYGEIHIAIKRTKDIVALAKGKADKRRKEKAAERTPYMFEVWNPRNCYYEVDQFGLRSHFRRSTVQASRVISDWGDDAVPERYKNNKAAPVVLCEWWDLETHAVWVEGETAPILNDEHGLDFIPIVVQLSEGSWGLFNQAEAQAQPFLYSVAKSGMWKRQNLFLTSMMTNLHNFALNPTYLYQANTPGKKLIIDWSEPGGIASIEQGENFGPLDNTNLIHPSVLQAMEIINNLLTESTIYKQVLGEPLGKNAPYSMVALLSQAGRLPLVSPQRRIGWAIAKTMELALLWLKSDTDTGTTKVKYGTTTTEIATEDIPDDLELECQLEISLPQDNLQNANVAAALTQGDDPMVSNEWVRENILKIGQPNEMQKKIWAEKIASLFARRFVEEQMRAMEQAMQQPPAPAPGMGTEGPPEMGMEGMPEGPGMGMPPPGQGPGAGPPGVRQSPNIPLTPGQPPQTAGLPPPREVQA